MQTLKFNIDSASLLQSVSDDQLAIAEVYVCHDGTNSHNMPISLEDLKEAAPTILNKFLVADYDGYDFLDHTKTQRILGFFPAENDLRFVEKDGKTYFVANAIISKVYVPWAYDLFTDENYKSVSMEISVLETEDIDGATHIKKFVFNGVTVLGDKVNPACAGSNAQIFKFSQEEFIESATKFYHNFSNKSKEDFSKYDTIDFKIPKSVKENAKRGLELRKEYKRGGTSVGVNSANYLVSNDSITPEKVRHVAKYFPRHKGDNLSEKNPPSNGWIAWCLSEDTEILMSDGTTKTAKEICDNKIDDYVVSYNTETKMFENKRIVNWFINDSTVEDFYVIGKDKQNRRGVSNKTKIHITGEHPFYSNGEWIEAKDMKDRDFYTIDYKPDYVSDQILRGVLLGDGCINADRITATHSIKQEDYTREIGRLLGDFTSGIQIKKGDFKGFSNGTDKISFRTKSSAYIKSLKDEMYIEGNKIVTKDYLNKLSDIGIAFWVCDDGSLHKTENKNSISYNYRLHIEGFDYQSCLNIVEYFNNMGIESYLVKRENCDGSCLYFTHEGSLKLFERIGKYIPECMNYKKIDESKYDYDLNDHVAYSEFLLNEETVKVFEKLSNLSRHTANKDKHSKKYNFTVEDNNNYFANGMLVHNCLWGGHEGWSWSQKIVDKMDAIDEKDFSVGEELGKEESIKINNSKESAIMSETWNGQDADFLNKLLKASNHESLINEAYLITDKSGDVSVNDVHYPHHSIKNGELVVNKKGVISAFQRAKQQGITGEPINHLKRHYKELGLDTENFSEGGKPLDKAKMMEMASKMECMAKYAMMDMGMEYAYAVDKDSKMMYAIPYKMSDSEEMEFAMEDMKKAKMACKYEMMADDEEEDKEVYMAMGKIAKMKGFNDDQNVEGVAQAEENEKETDKMKEEAKEEDGDSDDVKMAMNDMEMKMAEMAKENEELKKFKEEVEMAQKQAKVDMESHTMAEKVNAEFAETWRAKVDEFDNVDAWANAMKAMAFSLVIEKKEPETKTFSRMDIPNLHDDKNETKPKKFWEM